VAPSAELANVSPVAQHPCYSIDTEVHFELKAGEKLLLVDDPSVLAVYEFDIGLHNLLHLEPQHYSVTAVSPQLQSALAFLVIDEAMELEPDFLRLSFDLSLSGVDRPVQYDTPADTIQSTTFDTPSEAAIAMLANSVSVNVCSLGGSIGTDSNLTDPWSFYQDGGLSGNKLVSTADASFWGEMEQALLAFQPDSGTCPTDGKVLTTSPMNGSPPNWPDLLPHETSHLLSESNCCSDITFCACGHELSGFCKLGCQVLDFAHAQLAGMNTLNEYDLNNYSKYIYSNTNGGYSNPTLNFQLKEAAHPLLGNHCSEKQSGLADNLYVRPEVLALSPSYHSPLAQPRHPEDRKTDEDRELLTAIHIIRSPLSSLPPSHPIPAFDDLIVNFDLNPRPPPTKRKRSSFTRAGKEKVRLVRDSGACVFCRSRKVSVGDLLRYFPCSALTSNSALLKKCAINADELLMIQ
jgi:hypothetical protein